MNTIVIYKSKTGFTKKYAEWIAEELSCKVISLEKIKTVNLESYDTIVFGGWTFVGAIQGLKEIKAELLKFNGKKAVFATGAMKENVPEARAALDKSFNVNEHKQIATFYMQGGLDYKHMSFVHRAMMKMMRSVLKKEKGAESDDYKNISTSFDATRKAAVESIVKFVME